MVSNSLASCAKSSSASGSSRSLTPRDGHDDRDVLARELAGLGDRMKVALLAFGQAGDRVVEALGMSSPAADLVGQAVGGEVLDRLAVARSRRGRS